MTLEVLQSSMQSLNESESLILAAEEICRLFPNRKIRKVLFVIPPDADESLFNYGTAKRGRYWNYPPYGIAVIASHLRNASIECACINLNNKILESAFNSESETDFNFTKTWKQALEKAVKEEKPDLIGLSCMFTQTHSSTVSVLNHLKKFRAEIPVAIGGVHITNCLVSEKMAVSMIEDLALADLFFTYESEIAIKTFVNVVNRELPVRDLIQVYFNQTFPKVSFVHVRKLPDSELLDVLPALDLLGLEDISEYGKIGSFYCHKKPGIRFATALSNRGCRARCTFCSVRNFNGAGVRSRSVQSVVDELLVLRNEYGIGHIMWLDDDFLKGRDRTLKLFNEMVRQNVDLTWDCTNGVIAASCTEEIIAAAAESGCIGLNIGMESGNPKILRDIRKPGTVDNFLKAAHVLRKFEQINSRVFLMLGFPGETYRMILDTLKVSMQMDLDWYNVTILQPLPNTPIFESMIEQGLVEDVGFDQIRYNSGAYGKHRKIVEQTNSDLLCSDFQNAFEDKDLDIVPGAHELDIIWSYLNYHLNFKRLFSEKRPLKLKQQLEYVQNITDLVAPENAFAMYFAGFLQKEINGHIDLTIVEKLEERLASSKYWQSKFNDFHLSLDHLKEGTFPQRELHNNEEFP